mgnify:CR=1 FL=1
MEQNNTLFARKRSDLEGRERGRIRGWKTESPSAKKKQRGNRRPGDSRGFRWIAEDRRSTMEREQEEETRAKLGRNRTILHISQSKRERDRDRDKDRDRVFATIIHTYIHVTYMSHTCHIHTYMIRMYVRIHLGCMHVVM